MKYFAIINGEQRGPFELEQLPEVGVRPSTYVWCKEMADWEKAEDVADICRLFRRRIHDLMHPGSTAAEQARQQELKNTQQTLQDDIMEQIPPRFRKIVEESGTTPGPPITQEPDYDTPPMSMLPYALFTTIFCFPLTGIVAIYYAVTSRRAWAKGDHKKAHELVRSAKMWVGITFFMGFFVAAFALRKLF